jgi:hypothetical protein
MTAKVEGFDRLVEQVTLERSDWRMRPLPMAFSREIVSVVAGEGNGTGLP